MSQLSTDWTRPMKCDQCPHPISEHTIWNSDELCAGWMHCTADGCTTCWHSWPRPSQAASLKILSAADPRM